MPQPVLVGITMDQQLIEELWKLQIDPSREASSILVETNISADEGQWIQLEMLGRWLNEGEELGGWKIGMTSGDSRDALGKGIRPFGFVLRNRLFQSGAHIPRATLHNGGVENELCFFMGENADFEKDANKQACKIVSCAAGFEINQKRLPAGCAPGIRVADNLSNWGIVAGDRVEPPRNLKQLTVTLKKYPIVENDREIEIASVKSEGHIDDHYQSLEILNDRLAEFGQKLEPGQWVITGAYGKHPFEEARFEGAFDLGLGHVEVTLTPTQ